jgi:hypothetical protein
VDDKITAAIKPVFGLKYFLPNRKKLRQVKINETQVTRWANISDERRRPKLNNISVSNGQFVYGIEFK